MKQSTQNYLKTIFSLAYPNLNKPVRASAISKRLDISAPSVTEKLKKMNEAGYITNKKYSGIILTEKGLKIGRNMVRHHRLWELFLTQILGLSWDEVHEEAERLEHAGSDKIIDRIEELLEFPKFDPHGNPIPARDGSMPSHAQTLKLSEAQIGKKYRITSVVDFEQKFLTYLTDLGVVLKNTIKVLECLEFDESLLCSINSKKIPLSKRAADQIFVQEC